MISANLNIVESDFVSINTYLKDLLFEVKKKKIGNSTHISLISLIHYNITKLIL